MSRRPSTQSSSYASNKFYDSFLGRSTKPADAYDSIYTLLYHSLYAHPHFKQHHLTEPRSVYRSGSNLYFSTICVIPSPTHSLTAIIFLSRDFRGTPQHLPCMLSSHPTYVLDLDDDTAPHLRISLSIYLHAFLWLYNSIYNTPRQLPVTGSSDLIFPTQTPSPPPPIALLTIVSPTHFWICLSPTVRRLHLQLLLAPLFYDDDTRSIRINSLLIECSTIHLQPLNCLFLRSTILCFSGSLCNPSTVFLLSQVDIYRSISTLRLLAMSSFRLSYRGSSGSDSACTSPQSFPGIVPSAQNLPSPYEQHHSSWDKYKSILHVGF
eukprot:jgi/Psemu1/59095/gm1.59095_g